MRARISTSLLIAGAIVLLILPACRKRPVALVEYQNVAISSGSGKVLSLEDVRKSISVAAVSGKANWQLSDVELGSATATLNYKNDVIVVRITYTETTLSISGGDGRTQVHPKYNQFIAALLKAIQRELARI